MSYFEVTKCPKVMAGRKVKVKVYVAVVMVMVMVTDGKYTILSGPHSMVLSFQYNILPMVGGGPDDVTRSPVISLATPLDRLPSS